MGAMTEEVGHLREKLEQATTETIGRREYHVGRLAGRDVCLAFSRWGKVAAASTATTMIDRYGASELLFTGVAGGVDSRLRIGDVVVADVLFQHDLDGSPLFPRLEVPLLGTAGFRPDGERVERATKASMRFLDGIAQHVAPESLATLGITNPKVHQGPIASGDQFISNEANRERIASLVPGVLCVEMEGAAVAQVAFERDVPFTVIRVISDSAAMGAAVDFRQFVREVASHYMAGIVRELLLPGAESPSGYASRDPSHGNDGG